MDKIFIRDLEVRSIIGLYPHERTAKQALIFNLELRGDFSDAGRTDTLTGTVNYREVEEKLIDLAEHSSFLLLEALAEAAADLCLSFDAVQSVLVSIDKPAAALRARSIAIQIERGKNH